MCVLVCVFAFICECMCMRMCITVHVCVFVHARAHQFSVDFFSTVWCSFGKCLSHITLTYLYLYCVRACVCARALASQCVYMCV